MALKGIQVCSVAVFAALLFAVAANAQSSDCTTVIISLSPCLDYLTGNTTTPASACCTQLSSVVKSNPECLCQVLNGDSSSFNINKTQALGLPTACNVQTPSISMCNAGSPSGSPSNTPAAPGGGSKTTPPKDGGSSHATSTTFQFYVLFMSLLVASFAST